MYVYSRRNLVCKIDNYRVTTSAEQTPIMRTLLGIATIKAASNLTKMYSRSVRGWLFVENHLPSTNQNYCVWQLV